MGDFLAILGAVGFLPRWRFVGSCEIALLPMLRLLVSSVSFSVIPLIELAPGFLSVLVLVGFYFSS